MNNTKMPLQFPQSTECEFRVFFLSQGRVRHLGSHKDRREDARPTQTEAETVSVQSEKRSLKVLLSLQKKY